MSRAFQAASSRSSRAHSAGSWAARGSGLAGEEDEARASADDREAKAGSSRAGVRDRAGHERTRSSRTGKTLPLPGWLSTSIVPWWRRTISRAR